MRRIPFALLLFPTLLLAQKPAPRPTTPKAATKQVDAAVKSLPVTRVSLYKNGVGFFEHTGQISGNAAVTLSFTSGQLNDVLQSLTAIDLNGGRIAGAGYNSTTPLDQQLKNLPLALGEDPTAADFYAAIRGARVEVRSGTASITGRLLSMETRTTPTSTDNSKPAAEKQFLTVVSDTGEVRTLELTPVTSVRLLDTELHTDVSRYLQLIDSNHNQGLRHLTINDNGTGPRELKLSYISEVPIWKSTYRILFTDPATKPGTPEAGAPSSTGGFITGQGGVGTTTTPTATLQGWSVVDNTTGTDWTNVHLSLIAGAPQSFIQPLSQPIYSRRPEIPIAEESQLTPQTHDSSIDNKSFDSLSSVAKLEAPQPRAMALQGRSVSSLKMARPGGVMGGMAGGTGNGVGAASETVTVAAAPAVSYEDAATESLTPTTTTAAFDDFFAYNLTEPVTIRKNESALVPILQAKVPTDRVTLVSSNGSTTSQPLRALWITNTSGLTLDRGSFSIVENGNFDGEGLLDPIHPNEKRLLSYAADQAIHVTTESNLTSQRIDRITAAKGVLKLQHADVREITYLIHNAAPDARTVILEHPIYNGYKIDSDPAPTETTGSLYRFREVVQPGETDRLHVGEKHRGATTYQLTNSDDNQLTLILNQTNHNPALEAALQPILAARRQVADAQTAVNQTNAHLTALRSDEDRQRANITALATADKASRDRFVRDLNKTEDAIATAQTELTTRTTALDAAHANLSTSIQNLQLNETL
jgi:hypothetical protein